MNRAKRCHGKCMQTVTLPGPPLATRRMHASVHVVADANRLVARRNRACAGIPPHALSRALPSPAPVRRRAGSVARAPSDTPHQPSIGSEPTSYVTSFLTSHVSFIQRLVSSTPVTPCEVDARSPSRSAGRCARSTAWSIAARTPKALDKRVGACSPCATDAAHSRALVRKHVASAPPGASVVTHPRQRAALNLSSGSVESRRR